MAVKYAESVVGELPRQLRTRLSGGLICLNFFPSGMQPQLAGSQLSDWGLNMGHGSGPESQPLGLQGTPCLTFGWCKNQTCVRMALNGFRQEVEASLGL